jgi:hypothetical protein
MRRPTAGELRKTQQTCLFSHTTDEISTEIIPLRRGPIVQYSVATEEKSFREESEIEARWRIGNETPLQATEEGGRRDSFCDKPVRNEMGHTGFA